MNKDEGVRSVSLGTDTVKPVSFIRFIVTLVVRSPPLIGHFIVNCILGPVYNEYKDTKLFVVSELFNVAVSILMERNLFAVGGCSL